MFQSPEFGESPDGGIFDLRVPGQSLKKRNCHNSKCSDHIDMKLGPEEEKQKKTKKLTMTSCQKVVTSLPFFQFTTDLKQFGSGIPDA